MLPAGSQARQSADKLIATVRPFIFMLNEGDAAQAEPWDPAARFAVSSHALTERFSAFVSLSPNSPRQRSTRGSSLKRSRWRGWGSFETNASRAGAAQCRSAA